MKLNFYSGTGQGPIRKRLGTIAVLVGFCLVVLGGFLVVPRVADIFGQVQSHQTELKQWGDPGSALTKPLPTGTNPLAGVGASICGSGALANQFALVTFPTLAGLSGVAGNGDWDMLTQRSMVHYTGTPGPGQAGNGVYAFHREPIFESMNQLKVGSPVIITDRSCKKWTYVVTQIWIESPNSVTQLNATPPADGDFVTLITCNPLWLDYQRLVIRTALQA